MGPRPWDPGLMGLAPPSLSWHGTRDQPPLTLRRPPLEAPLVLQLEDKGPWVKDSGWDKTPFLSKIGCLCSPVPNRKERVGREGRGKEDGLGRSLPAACLPFPVVGRRLLGRRSCGERGGEGRGWRGKVWGLWPEMPEAPRGQA